MSVPLTVIMTVRNGEPFVREAVQSILTQTYRDFEFLVVDNGSTDSSIETVRSFRDPRVRIIRLKRNIGRPQALNLALEEARGDYVAVQDADDVSFPTRLEKQMAYLNEHPEVALLGTWYQFINETGEVTNLFRPPVGQKEILDFVAYANPFAHSSVIYRRQLVRVVGAYPTDYVQAHDLFLWLQLSFRFTVANLSEELVAIRMHQEQESKVVRLKVARSWDALRIYRSARTHPNVSGQVKNNNSLIVAIAMLGYAEALFEAGHRTRAFRWMASALLQHPLICARNRHLRAQIARLTFGEAGYLTLRSLKRRMAGTAQQAEEVGSR